MKLKLLKEELMTPLEMAAGAADRGVRDDVHSHVRLQADKGNMQITGVGMHVQVSGEAHSGVEGEADTTLPAKKLLDICKTLPDGSQIAIDIGSEAASLKAGRSRFKLRVFSPDSFPAHAEEKPEVSLEIPAGKLRQMLGRTSFAMAQNDVRRYLTGMLLELRAEGGAELRAVATDGHRLAMSSCPLEPKSLKQGKENTCQVILPMDMVQQMRRLLDNIPAGDNVRLELNEKSGGLLSAERQVQSLAIDGSFPDYERVIPALQDQALQMLRAPLREALARAAVLVENEPTHAVKLQLGAGKIQVQADNQLGEEYEEELDAEYAGEALSIAFNLNYLREMLDACASPQFRMHVTDASSSVRVEPVPAEEEPEELQTTYVLMPMRL